MERKVTKENILAVIAKFPGCRRRFIAARLKGRTADLIAPIDELVREGKIRIEFYKDPAQMEFFDRFYIC